MDKEGTIEFSLPTKDTDMEKWWDDIRDQMLKIIEVPAKLLSGKPEYGQSALASAYSVELRCGGYLYREVLEEVKKMEDELKESKDAK